MEKNRIQVLKNGDAVRMNYSKIHEVLEMPNLIEVQKNSYQWFLKEGLKEIFEDISPITDFNDNLVLEFIDFSLDSAPKYSIEECKERDTTYAAALKVKARLYIREIDDLKEQEIFMGDFPLMTDTGTFIINGAERVIVSQLVRSPGIYYASDFDKVGKKLLSSTVIPNRGAWLEYETDSNDIFYVRVDRQRKVPVTALIRAFGVGTDSEIIDMFGDEPKILASIEKDIAKSHEEGLIEIYKKLRPGEPPTVESSKSLLDGMFFDPKRYDLAHVGRYKFNKKLALRNRVRGAILGENVVDPMTGEVVAEAGVTLTMELCDDIQNTGVSAIFIEAEERNVKILTNQVVDINLFIEEFGLNGAELGIKEAVYYPVLEQLLEEYTDTDELAAAIRDNVHELVPKHITLEDIFASINYIIHLDYEYDNSSGFKYGNVDDIDHLGNRRIRSVGELLQNQFRIGLSRMERVVRERMTTQDLALVTPQALINVRPVTATIKEFFGSSQLSQFMDQNNPLSELTHKRRLSALGPGGLSRERAGFEVRDVHYSHYGRMCPIETPEGPNIGLINTLATFARINEYGFIEAPYRKIDHSGDEPKVTEDFVYMTADEEENFNVAQANEPLDLEGYFINKKVTGRHKEDVIEVDRKQVQLMDVSPKQMVSVATALIPFLENDDANRALMGSNMQRQAVPLMVTDSPIIGTGMEHKTAKDSGICVLADNDGVVERIEASEIVIRTEQNTRDRYNLIKYQRSNQDTCLNQKPIVNVGDSVKAGDIIADGASTDNGELALGKNPLIGFMTWEGYNYEDAVLLSEKLVQEDVYTSVHINEHEADARDTKLGAEEITRDIPNVGDDALKDLDSRGIIRIGAEVRPNDILVGKVTPKGETELTAEERLLRAIFAEKTREVRDTSLRVPHGETGIVVDVKIFTRENGDEVGPGVNQLVHVYIAQKRKISVGDKMAGRHGNKGVVSRVLPVEDMPFLPNGRPLDIVLNPLGIPSRMNIGQVLETHLSLAAKALGWKISTPVFDGAHEIDIMDTLEMANDYVNMSWIEFSEKWEELLEGEIYEELYNNRDHREEWKGVKLSRDGKVDLRDGRSGDFFDNRVTIGFMHYLKLHHLVDDKIHARSTGPYSLVTQQPLGGKAQFGGQRFGEMEVWALEAYGAAYTLQEILTVKSDDIVGRVKTYESIVKGENIPEPGVPESFKVLLKELQSLGLDIRVLREDQTEVEIRESIDEIDDLNVNIDHLAMDDELQGRPLTEEEELVGYLLEDHQSDEKNKSQHDVENDLLSSFLPENMLDDDLLDEDEEDDDLLEEDDLLDEEDLLDDDLLDDLDDDEDEE
ncbi:MAG: DNA-directed RNA polymerase subunit beta [Bacillota bacterium]